MKKIILPIIAAISSLMIFGCGPDADEIAKAIEKGTINSGNDVIYNLAYEIGTFLSGTFSNEQTTQYFRVVEGTDEPSEQQGADYNGSGPKVTQTADRAGARYVHIIGSSLVKDYPTDAGDYTYSSRHYLAEAREDNEVSEIKTVTTEGSTETTTTDREYDTSSVGQLSYYEFQGLIWTGYIGGDAITPIICIAPGNCPPRAIGKKNPSLNDFWVADGVIYRMLGFENMDLIIDGQLRNVRTAKVEMRYGALSADPEADYIETCLPWTSTGTNETDRDDVTIEAPDCPARIVGGIQWWYKNMLVKSSMTYETLQPYAGVVQVAPQTDTGGPLVAFDPGYGFEIYRPCDHDDDPATANVDCRYFALTNDATVGLIGGGGGGGGGDPTTLDFTTVNADNIKQYFHFSLVTTTDTWLVTELGSRDVPEGSSAVDEPGAAAQ